MTNSIFVIHPYKYHGMWVFDDEKVNLVREPFVGGADDVIDQMTQHIPDAENGFNLVFSASPFPDYQLELLWSRSDLDDGNYYFSPILQKEGWLCPALLKYFEKPPEKIYASFKAKK